MIIQILHNLITLRKYRHCEPEGRSNLVLKIASLAFGLLAMTKRGFFNGLNLRLLLGIFFLSSGFLFSGSLKAQEPDASRIRQLEGQILSGQQEGKDLEALDELSRLYFSVHQYNQFADFLKKAPQGLPGYCSLPWGYYLALCRFHQLKYLEETQSWQEYFDQGNVYRQELFEQTEKVVSLCPLSAFSLRAMGLNWLSLKAQNDALQDASLDRLIALINNYVKQGPSDIGVIKEVADILSKEEELPLAKSVYSLYVKGLLKSRGSAQDLAQAAQDALRENNLSLAEILYDHYLETIKGQLSQEQLAARLADIARQFCAEGDVPRDRYYAEKIFTALKERCPRGCLDQELQYLRAYNLQKIKDYERAAQEYEIYSRDFPRGGYLDEAEFKAGIIYIYILSQEEKGLGLLSKVIERNGTLPYTIESLYHQSLISHYAGDLEKAGSGYARILELLSGRQGFKNLKERLSLRQAEVLAGRPIEHNLKTFLDGALGTGAALGRQGTAFELTVAPEKAFTAGELTFGLNQPQLQTGCFVPEFTYLWSGDIGSISPVPAGASFASSYPEPGAKIVNLAVLTPEGRAGAGLEIVDVYEKK